MRFRTVSFMTRLQYAHSFLLLHSYPNAEPMDSQRALHEPYTSHCTQYSLFPLEHDPTEKLRNHETRLTA
jgi:hypothetical protein